MWRTASALTGNPGSPVVALQTFLEHRSRPALLSKSEFNFLFIERDPENLASLHAELDRLNPLPQRINVEMSDGDAFEKLSELLKELRGKELAPAFMFVDPYGFKIPTLLLAALMKAGRVELFINIMWRELDMLIQQRPAPGTSYAQTLEDIFGCEVVDVGGANGHWRPGDTVPVASSNELRQRTRPDEGVQLENLP